MRVALIHDWLTGRRGGEKCLEVFGELFPDAPIHTLVHEPGAVSAEIDAHPIVPSFLQRIPGAVKRYRAMLPLMPAAIEQLDLEGYDLILSSSHCVAKGVIPSPEALHLSYVHTPMRYAWDLRHTYLRSRGRLTRAVAPFLLQRLREWDVHSAARVDHFAANSSFVAQRIRRYYRRDSEVIHPPVDTDFFEPPGGGEESGQQAAARGDRYLMVTALVPSKGVDEAIEAFRILGRPLDIVGGGPMERTLKRRAPENVRFLGWVSDDEVRRRYAEARAVVVAGIEDFGIVPLEAAAMGCPVIAPAQGGTGETVIPADRPNPVGPVAAGRSGEPTGILFDPPRADALVDAVQRFERLEQVFEPGALRAHALGFGRDRFKREILAFIDRALEARSSRGRRVAHLDMASRPS
ncbi:hypothetical protein ABI59_21160 [Acidobacteria bacterium Mor1]|nr:hypothetical protein ABI59_21160 [Acidobacteria bacterium Mor1]